MTKEDYISRQAAVETMRKAKDKSEAHRMLMQLPSAHPGWIPCSERLPEENMWTICQNNAGAMMIGKYDIEFGWMFPAYFDGTVAWQPLPTPYREGGQDERTD